MSKPDTSVTKVYARPDNTYAIVPSSSDIRHESILDFVVAAIGFILALILRAINGKGKPLTKDQRESLYYSLIVLSVCIGINIVILLLFTFQSAFNSVYKLILYKVLVILIIAFIISIIACKKMKRK